jgi:hypothetical protein
MQTDHNQNTRTIPPIPGGGSWTFDESQWAWISNDPAPADAPADAPQAEAATEQAAPAIDQE